MNLSKLRLVHLVKNQCKKHPDRYSCGGSIVHIFDSYSSAFVLSEAFAVVEIYNFHFVTCCHMGAGQQKEPTTRLGMNESLE